MRDIKVKEVKHDIKRLDKKADIEYYEKKAEIKTKDKENTKGKEEETSSSSPYHQAVDKVVKREKKTATESAFYARKYTKNKRINLQVVKTREFSSAEQIKKHSGVKTNPQTIKQKSVTPRERTVSSRIRITNKNIKKNNYNQYMKQLGVRKKQKKMKEATQKTFSVLHKGASATGKSVKVAFKAIVKTVSSVQNLIGMGGALILLVVLTLFIGVFASLSSDSGVETSTLPLSEEVLSYTDTINKYAKENEIEDYVSLLQAIMMQESQGKGNDPMQSSEYEYNTRYPQKVNAIKEPEYSIEVGVKYFAECLKEANPKDSLDMKKLYLALQGYDFKKDYISWAVTNFNEYTRANAKVYSDEMKAKLQVDAYGDPNYVNHVLQYYHMGNGDIVKVALTQVGNINGKPYWEWYGFTSRVEWCACFVSWCANEAGLLEKGTIPKFSYCPTGIQWFKEHNQWMNKGQIPQAGYIIFFDWEVDGISDHVGIVERVENGIVYTIEGNSNNECRRNSYTVSSNVIVGYGVTK